MAVNDRWTNRDKTRSPEYGCRERWQVRWRDDQGRQRKKSFALKAAAQSYDAEILKQLEAGTYVDPSAGQVTFRAFAEDWRKTRMHDQSTAERIESALRCHAYPVLGDYPLRILAKRATILQGWISGLALNANSARTVTGYVSQVFTAAADDGLIARNPLAARSIQKPEPVKTEAIPWTLAEVEAVAEQLPEWLAAVPYLGAAIGARQGELFALAKPDLDFLRRTVRVEAQIKVVGGRQVFAPLKNRKPRDIPLAGRVLPIVAEHMRRLPPVEITLPWHDLKDPARHGKPITRALIFTRPGGLQLEREAANRPWRAAWAKAGHPRPRPRERLARHAPHGRVPVAQRGREPGEGGRVPRRHDRGRNDDLRPLHAGR